MPGILGCWVKSLAFSFSHRCISCITLQISREGCSCAFVPSHDMNGSNLLQIVDKLYVCSESSSKRTRLKSLYPSFSHCYISTVDTPWSLSAIFSKLKNYIPVWHPWPLVAHVVFVCTSSLSSTSFSDCGGQILNCCKECDNYILSREVLRSH